MSKPDYIDRTILRLRRKYGKDELVATLNKQLSEAQVEIGKLKSEVDHLSQILQSDEHTRQVRIQAKVEVKKNEMYNNVKAQNKKLQELNKKLRSQVSDLIAKVVTLQKRVG